jgi:crotonobetainyl-CoA hydratase
VTGTVRYERDGHVALLTLNRPEALNAVNAALADELGGHLERAAADAEVRAIVVTGAGRAFCAGADLQRKLVAAAIARRPRDAWAPPGSAWPR